MYYPGISIIVPTQGRVELLSNLLRSLDQARQQYDGPSEVLIIDSSTGKSKSLIERACAQYSAIYILGSTNVRKKRNLGIERSQYPILLFTDSDCTADANLLIEHGRIFHEDVTGELGGVVGITEFIGPRSRLWDVIEKKGILAPFTFAKEQNKLSWGPTSNISYRRDLVVQVGKFDTSLPFRLGGDDIDLGQKITLAGYNLVGNTGAVVFHSRETWNSYKLIGKRLWRWGRVSYHLFLKYEHTHSILLPRPSSILFLITGATLARAILYCSVLDFIILPLWIILGLGLYVSFLFWKAKLSKDEIVSTISSSILDIVYEFGAIFEGMVHADLRMVYMEADFSTTGNLSYRKAKQESYKKLSAQMWAIILALIICIVFIPK